MSLLIIAGCSFRKDYYELSIDDYSITVGYDDCKYLDVAYDFDIKQQLDKKEVVKEVNIYLFDDLLGEAEISNLKNKVISYEDGKLTKLVVYVNDLNGRNFKINDTELVESVQDNCINLNGTYVKKNGYACVLENNIGSKLNVVELHGDYLNIDQDKLDHIVIYVE